MELNKRDFLFSVIMPVYNVEPYLREAVESVISQTIGFEENIQIILVNDGSIDGSGSICKEYRDRYPQNIIYIEKENGGVSSARNAGLEHAKGRYINFLDSDDSWNIEAFDHVARFFDEHPGISIVTGRLILTDRYEGKVHHLDYKYKNTREVDISKSFKMPEMSCSKSFIKEELLKNIRFDEEVPVSEDLLLINTLLLKEGRYGIVKEAEYYYRKREDESSAIDRSAQTAGWYTATPKRVFKKLLDLSIREKGEVIPYIQYLLITDLQWRINRQLPDWLTPEEKKEYLTDIRDVLKEIEDKYIIKQRRMRLGAKCYALRMKYGGEIPVRTTHKIAETLKVDAILLDARGGRLVIQGRANEKILGEDYCIEVRDNKGDIWRPEYRPYPFYDVNGIDSLADNAGQVHILSLPLENGRRYRFYITESSGWAKRIDIRPGYFSRLTEYEDSFFAADGHIIKKVEDTVRVYDYHLKTFLASTYRYNKKLAEEYEASKEIISIRRSAVIYRMMHRKPLWLLSDRPHPARENARDLFEYLKKNGADKKYDICLLMEKDSPDYEKMRKLGKVAAIGSREHLIMQAAADMIITSDADSYNPFGDDYKYYRDLMDPKVVFLCQGITEDDLPGSLHKYKRNIRLFITAAEPEAREILTGGYGYSEDEVRSTGSDGYAGIYSELVRLQNSGF